MCCETVCAQLGICGCDKQVLKGGRTGDLKWFGLCDRLTYFVFYELFVSVYALLCLYLCEDHIGCIIRVRIFLRQETIFPQCLFQTWLRLYKRLDLVFIVFSSIIVADMVMHV